MSDIVLHAPMYNSETSVQHRYADSLTLKQAERKLTVAYKDRSNRYSKSVHGRGCFSEDNMAKTITALENRVDDLGGDSTRIYRETRTA